MTILDSNFSPRRLVLVAAAFWPASLALAQDPALSSIERARDETDDRRAFVELVLERDAHFVYEPIHVAIRFGVDAQRFDASAVQLFHAPLDVPVQLEARWLAGFGDATPFESAPRERSTLRSFATFALGDVVLRAARLNDRNIDGRTFRVFEIERAFVAEQPGTLEVPATLLRFAYATRFRDDLVHGRVPDDRHDAFVRGAPRAIQVRALPEAGRPIEFGGAVGRFTIRAEASNSFVNAGESVQLVVTVEGEGNFGRFAPPRIDPRGGLELHGVLDDVASARLASTFDLVPRSEDVRELPRVAFAFFDPAPPGTYRVVATDAIPLRVLPAGESKPLPIRVEASEPDEIAGAPPHVPSAGFGARPILNFLLVVSLFVLAVLGFGVARVLRARARDARDPEGARARAAADVLELRLRDGDADVGEAFADYLAARLRCPRAAVIAPDLEARLEVAGIPVELARRAHVFLDAHVAQRYGGHAPLEGLDDAREIVDALEASFRLGQTRTPKRPQG